MFGVYEAGTEGMFGLFRVRRVLRSMRYPWIRMYITPSSCTMAVAGIGKMQQHMAPSALFHLIPIRETYLIRSTLPSHQASCS